MTGYQSKKAAAQAKLEDDDDIQDYKKPWVGLTEEETSGFTPHEMAVVKYVSKVLQEKNT
jgi:hypothetical protein